MKRLFAILLPVLLCMSLLACGEQPPEETQVQVIIDKIETVENSSALVLLSVNPSFEIYAGDGGIIQKVVAVNADAEKVLGGKDYQGVSVNVCIPELLDTLRQQGFLKDGSELSISTYVHEHSFPSFDYRQQIEDILVACTSANQINITYSNTLDVIPAQSTDNTLPPPSADNTLPPPSADPETPEHTQKYDANGNLIEVFTSPNGERLERHYNADKVLEMLLEYYVDGGRVETWYDADGRTTKRKTYDTDGRCSDHAEWNYRADGYTVFHYDGVTGAVNNEKVFTSDEKLIKLLIYGEGGKIEEYYDESEKIYRRFVQGVDGVSIDEYYYYDESGKVCRTVSQGVDGLITDEQYHESGSTEYVYSDMGQLIGKTEYDTEGIILFSNTYDPDTGKLVHENKYENGVMTSWFAVEGDIQRLHTYVDGIQVKEEIYWSDGAYEIITYDSNGYRSVGTTYHTDGSYVIMKYAVDGDGVYVCGEAYYDSAGNLTEEYTFASRAEWVNHYLPGGPI